MLICPHVTLMLGAVHLQAAPLETSSGAIITPDKVAQQFGTALKSAIAVANRGTTLQLTLLGLKKSVIGASLFCFRESLDFECFDPLLPGGGRPPLSSSIARW